MDSYLHRSELTGEQSASNSAWGIGLGGGALLGLGARDPAPGVRKACQVGCTWVTVAEEGAVLLCPTPRTVRYGYSGLGLGVEALVHRSSWKEQVVQGRVEATNEYFGGDPMPHRKKVLQIAMPPRSTQLLGE